jgi:hypothetical protein
MALHGRRVAAVNNRTVHDEVTALDCQSKVRVRAANVKALKEPVSLVMIELVSQRRQRSATRSAVRDLAHQVNGQPLRQHSTQHEPASPALCRGLWPATGSACPPCCSSCWPRSPLTVAAGVIPPPVGHAAQERLGREYQFLMSDHAVPIWLLPGPASRPGTCPRASGQEQVSSPHEGVTA